MNRLPWLTDNDRQTAAQFIKAYHDRVHVEFANKEGWDLAIMASRIVEVCPGCEQDPKHDGCSICDLMLVLSSEH